MARIPVFPPMGADHLDGARRCRGVEESRAERRQENRKPIHSAGTKEMFGEFEIDTVDAVRRRIEQPRDQPRDVIADAGRVQVWLSSLAPGTTKSATVS
ncbi:MAG TPA: hypothetical protein VE999_05975 [Gemmataceae bacterium]|nr:hypothetical protein [Gemmataceae bacterium]